MIILKCCEGGQHGLHRPKKVLKEMLVQLEKCAKRRRARVRPLTVPPAVSYSTDLFLCALGAVIVSF